VTVKTCTFHIAVCNVATCSAEFDETSDYRGWADTPELALNLVRETPDSHWVVLADDTVVCPISDTVHYLARGGESPALLEAPGAMVVRFGDGIETRYPAGEVAA